MWKPNKQTLLLFLMAVTAMSIVVSNIITNKSITAPWGLAMTCGAFCIPLSYIADDVLAEVYGYQTARHVVWIGFACGLIAVLYFQATIWVQGDSSFTAQEAFETVLGAAARTTFASFVAYLAGSLANARVMTSMHERDGENHLAARCILSTVAGEFLDMGIFAVLAFAGTLPWAVIMQIIVSNACVKVALETVLYPVLTRRVIGWSKKLAN